VADKDAALAEREAAVAAAASLHAQGGELGATNEHAAAHAAAQHAAVTRQ
jgi:hypothetical protein